MNSVSKTRLFKFMRQTAARVDAFIMEELAGVSRDILIAPEAVLHLPAIRAGLGGANAPPKLRASFIRLVFELLSDRDWKQVLPVAAVGELLAISSYVIDDLLDHQEMRDGQPATWVRFGNADAIMAAQLQREIAERILLRLDMPERQILKLAELLNDIFYQGYLGQWIDSRMKTRCVLKDYINRCEKIAGHFHGGLAMMAAVVAGATEQVVEKVGRMGFSQGIALQIRNDLVDYIPSAITREAGSQALERAHFEDFRNGKWTMPLLHAYERATTVDQERIDSLLKTNVLSDAEITWLTHLLVSTGAYEFTLRLITSYKENARTVLLKFQPSPAREAVSVFLECVENSRWYVQKAGAPFG